MRKIYWLIAGSAMAMLLLISFQMYWIKKSKILIEEQFTNKVTMALCATVDKVSKSPECCEAVRSSCMTSPTGCTDQLNELIKNTAFTDVLNTSLNYFQINLPYKVNVASSDSIKSSAPNYSCSLEPLLAQNDQWVQLIFQGKKDYFNQKMRFTLLTSFLIVLLILSLFVYAARALFRQQKISEENRHFFNHMTHEFSTPLTNIQLAAKMMKVNTSSEKREAYLDIINQQCVQLKQQVDNVLNLASLDQTHFTLNKVTIDLESLATEVVDSMKMQIQEKNATVHIHSPDQSFQILGDRQHLSNVFRNLIDNALKYSPTIPQINIDFTQGTEGCYIRVSDNGHGIHPNDQEKIFTRYFRASPDQNHSDSNQNIPSGFGLGLAYVKKILNLHQGDIRLIPSLATGTQFELYFPK